LVGLALLVYVQSYVNRTDELNITLGLVALGGIRRGGACEVLVVPNALKVFTAAQEDFLVGNVVWGVSTLRSSELPARLALLRSEVKEGCGLVENHSRFTADGHVLIIIPNVLKLSRLKLLLHLHRTGPTSEVQDIVSAHGRRVLLEQLIPLLLPSSVVGRYCLLEGDARLREDRQFVSLWSR